MPDATITSTASTFGTITGTFAADQSTVTGTITGVVAGTLTGSVGVPGPAGAPGQGVPVGGTAGQFLTKIDGTNYNTDWTTVNLSVYAVKANNLSDLADAPTARTNLGLGTMSTATASDYSTTTVANGLYYPLSGNPSSFLTASALTPYLTSADAATTYQTLAGMSSYLTTATAASTYAVIAAGQPVAGTTGQVLTKNSGTNYDSSWATPVVGDRYLTSSTTSNTLSNTTKTFTIGTGLSYTPTQNITISFDASNHMHGEVLTYNSGTGVLTVDINNHTGSGTYAVWVVNVGGVTPATSVAWGAITGTLSTQTDLQNALNLKLDVSTAASTYFTIASAANKADLASPTFTGTPTLPTGTIAVTQSPGNNTTAVATTAFVTAAVPAFGATADINSPSSTTKAASIDNVRQMLLNPGFQLLYLGVGVSGTALSGYYNSSGGRYKQYQNSATSGSYGQFTFDTNGSSIGYVGYTRGSAANVHNWSKKIWMSGRCHIGTWNSGGNGDANSIARINLGGKNGFGGGNLISSLRGIGWNVAGGGSAVMNLQVSDGSTLTTVASSFTPTLRQAFDWTLYSDGAGNVTLYINDAQVATTSAGPTGTQNNGLYIEGVDAIGASTAFTLETFGTKIYHST